jgi:hypothetical protein
MSPLASLKHQAEKDLSVPTGWKKSRQSQTAATMSVISESASRISMLCVKKFLSLIIYI